MLQSSFHTGIQTSAQAPFNRPLFLGRLVLEDRSNCFCHHWICHKKIHLEFLYFYILTIFRPTLGLFGKDRKICRWRWTRCWWQVSELRISIHRWSCQKLCTCSVKYSRLEKMIKTPTRTKATNRWNVQRKCISYFWIYF